MVTPLEITIARLINRLTRNRSEKLTGGLEIGLIAVENEPSKTTYFIPITKLTEHLAIFGKTGTGKSSLLHQMARQHIRGGRGWLFIDRHGQSTDFLLSEIAQREREIGVNLSDRVIVIRPSDLAVAVGFNLLEAHQQRSPYVIATEFAEILKNRWDLSGFGARTEELLRNTILVVLYSRLTLVEVAPLLTDASFLSRHLRSVPDNEVKQYFTLRYSQASEPMKAVLRDPILNKITTFTSNPVFRHIIGQKQSAFSLAEAMDQGKWIILSLPVGELGDQANTFASLFLIKLKNAAFARKTKKLFTVFIDEVQTLVASSSAIETMAAEVRKFYVGLVTANQFLDQLPTPMRAALLSVGTHCFFQSSGNDAQQLATFLDGGKPMAERLKNLPQRHAIVKSGHYGHQHVVVPHLQYPEGDGWGLYRRSLAHYGRKRQEIEQEIRNRNQLVADEPKEALDAWD